MVQSLAQHKAIHQHQGPMCSWSQSCRLTVTIPGSAFITCAEYHLNCPHFHTSTSSNSHIPPKNLPVHHLSQVDKTHSIAHQFYNPPEAKGGNSDTEQGKGLVWKGNPQARDLWREWTKALETPCPPHCLPPAPIRTAVKCSPIISAWAHLWDKWKRPANSLLAASLRNLLGKTPKNERCRHTKSVQYHTSNFLRARTLYTLSPLYSKYLAQW